MKKITLLFFFALLGIHTGYSQCNAPVINSFTPETGFIGSTVTIFGANFDATTITNNVVYFGATKATVQSANFGSLTVTVPVGASTAPISVTNACNKTATSQVPFNGIFCPTPLTTTTYSSREQVLPVSYGSYNMISQDMDLDGKPEVISVEGGGVSIAINNSTPGTISFSALNISGGGSSVAGADMDGDGLKEIITSTRIYRNTSTGPGSVSVAYANSVNSVTSYQIAAGDLNNDGKPDLIGESGGTVYVVLNASTGVGNFNIAARQNVGYVSHRCTGLQVADVDGDGKIDILATQGNGNRAVTLRNTTTPGSSTATFEAPEYWPTNGSYPYRCQIADFNKDGKIDLTTCNYSGATNTAIFRNTSTVGDISFATSVNLPAPGGNYRIGVGDVDGDGYTDVVTKSLASNVFSVYRNTTNSTTGNVTFAARIDYFSAWQAEVSGIVVGDLDGDYVPDIATSGWSSDRIVFHRNSSSQNDVTAPTAICKNITLALDPSGNATLTPEMIDNGSSDACGIDYMTVSTSSFTCANIGPNAVTLSVVDNAGNTTTCTATVNVAPAAVIIAGQTTVCQGQTISMSANLGDSYQWKKDGVDLVGETNQNYLATTSGAYSVEVTNVGGCSGVSDPVSVTVNNNPTVSTSPSSVAYLCGVAGTATITASQSAIYQWKLNGVNIPGATQQALVANAAGSYSVEVIDLFGCSAVSSAISVVATTAEINVTGNGLNIADGSTSASTGNGTDFGNVYPNANYTSTFTINSTGGEDLVVSAIGVNGADASSFSISGITLPMTIASGSSSTFDLVFNGAAIASYSAGVTITSNDCDETETDFAVASEITCVIPNFTSCLSNMNVSTDPGTCAAGVSYEISAFAAPAATYSYAYSGASVGSGTGTGSGNVFNIGTTTVTVTATNPCGTDVCSFDVIVSDNEAPNAVAQNVTVQLDASGNGSTTAALVDNGSSDACGIASMTIDNASFTCANVGSNNPVTLTVTDVNGNVSTSSAMVTVEDNVNPVAVAQNVTVQLDASGNGSTTAALVDNGSSDACGIASMTIENASFTCANVGSNNPVTLTVTDVNGNVSTSSAMVTVEDNVNPVAVAQNVTVQLDASGNGSTTAALVDNGSSDACGIASMTIDNASFTCVNVGSNNPVTLTVTDVNGNVSTASAMVTVEDNVNPVAVAQNVTVQLDASGNGSTTAALVDNGSSDACGIASMTIDNASFTCANVGSNNPVTLTVTDVNGNVSTASAMVTVEDNIAPLAVAQGMTIQLDASGAASITPSDIDNGSNDACGVASLMLDTMNFSCANVGPNTVTLTVTDNNGNVSSTTAIVMVEDNVNPITIAQDITVQLDSSGMASITPADVDNGSNDACGIASQVVDVDMFDCSNVGVNTVVLTTTDNNGNSSSDTVTVTIEDNVAPIASCRPITVTLANGMASITPDSIDDGSFDACGIASMTISDSTWDCTQIGAHPVTLTVTDVNGNVSNCVSIVTVVGDVPTLAIASGPSCNVNTGGDSSIIYLGYGPQTTSLLTTVTGGTSFTYAWTGTGLDSTNVANPVFTPTAEGYFTFNCTVTNEYGCDVMSSITICVRDIRVTCNTGNGHNHGSSNCKHKCNRGHKKHKKHGHKHGCSHTCGQPATVAAPTCIPMPSTCSHSCHRGHSHGHHHGYKWGCSHTCSGGHGHGHSSNNKKVYITHVTPARTHGRGRHRHTHPAKSKTLKVSVNAVAAHLSNHAGDVLGKYGESCSDFNTAAKTAETITEDFGEYEVSVLLYPNPSIDRFTVMVESDMDELVTVEVYDLAGNLVQTVPGQFTYSEIELGQNLSSGIYLVVIHQGDYKTVLKATKGN